MFDDTQVEETVETNQEVIQEAPQVTQEPVVEDEKEINYRKLRESKKALQRERDDAIRYAQEMEQRYRVPQQPAPEDIKLNPDDLVEWKHVDKRIKQLEEQITTNQKQSYETIVETKIRNQYPDFDKIVTADNIEMLKDTYPEVAALLETNGDLYNKAVSAYQFIRKFGIHMDNNFSKEKEIVQRNAAKPKPTNSIGVQSGQDPLTKANAFAEGLTDEIKKQLHREMLEARKNY